KNPLSASVDSLRQACLERTGLPAGSIDTGTIEQFLDSCLDGNTNKAPCDFRSSLPVLDDLTRSGTILGSPKFMSPEQVACNYATIGPRTDVYGLGATLFWLLTGEAVVSGRNLIEIFEKIPTELPKSLQELNARVPDSVECVVWKAIQKDPKSRYENCKVLAEELQCCLEGKKPAAQKSRERVQSEKRDSKYDNLFLKAFPRKAD
ncbi:MAG: hypothetical protein JSS02_22845, partial [Planctomycetes bacterium]|nr:hypothetical protein [Planctomycetota bacterium]